MSDSQLSAFIFTNGRSSFEYSLEALKKQSLPVDIHIIKNMTMIQGIRHALEVCNTKYFTKIDDDFLLHPKGLEFMWSSLKKYEDPKICMYWWHLWENWSHRPIQSIKIYNKEVAKAVKFRADKQGRVDIQFVGRIKKRGFKIYKNSSMPAIHGCAPWKEQHKYIKIWKKQASSNAHHKVRVNLMRRFRKKLKDQFKERKSLLQKMNKRYKTSFYKWLRTYDK